VTAEALRDVGDQLTAFLNDDADANSSRLLESCGSAVLLRFQGRSQLAGAQGATKRDVQRRRLASYMTHGLHRRLGGMSSRYRAYATTQGVLSSLSLHNS
jgi:hypothetical protein